MKRASRVRRRLVSLGPWVTTYVEIGEHECDGDCTVVGNECVVCGIGHGYPCGQCGARAFHVEGCPAVFDLEDHAWAQFPKRCGCGRVYDAPGDFETRTTAPGSGKSVAVQGGMPMWLRNCACGNTMAIELEEPE